MTSSLGPPLLVFLLLGVGVFAVDRFGAAREDLARNLGAVSW